MTAETKLALAAVGLKIRAPEDWEQFLGALRAYTDTQRDICIQAPVAALQTAQGRAQACAQLLKLLDNCRQTAETIESNKHGNATRY